MAGGLSGTLESVWTQFERESISAQCYRFADLRVRVRIRSLLSADGLLRMIAHRHTDDACDSEILVVEGPCPHLAPLMPPDGHRHARLVEATTDFYCYWTPERGGNLTILDRRRRLALLWYPTPGDIASWEFSRPFLAAIQAFMLPTAWTPVHAAAVAIGDAAILIAGPGGVGKTTTALVCAEAGWAYLSDDFVLVGGDPWRAESLYRSARMREDMFERLPMSMAATTGLSSDDGEIRAEVDVGAVGQLGTGRVRLRAIVVPERAGRPQASLNPIRRSRALSALAGSTLIALAGGRAETFAKIGSLVDALPCYGFEPGPHLADIPHALRTLI